MKNRIVIGGRYNFKFQNERLVYIGMCGNWHQFEIEGDHGVVWSELLDSDLNLLEETVLINGKVDNGISTEAAKGNKNAR